MLFLFEVKVSTLFTVLVKFGFHMHASVAHEIRNATSTWGIFSDLWITYKMSEFNTVCFFGLNQAVSPGNFFKKIWALNT